LQRNLSQVKRVHIYGLVSELVNTLKKFSSKN